MIVLRDYQIDMIDRTRTALKNHQRVLLQAPTGAGKTALACHMINESQKRGISSFFLVHQNELLQQTSRALWENKLQHGMISPKVGRSPYPVQLASIMTLKNRLNQYKEPGLIIIDESHRALANTYLEIIKAYPNAKVVGLTATPQRSDGRGLGHLFEDIVIGPSIRYLIDNGYLCDYELFGVPSSIVLDGVRSTGGDYNTKDLAQAANKAQITGDAIAHYRRLASGLRTVVMCVDIDHAEAVAKQYSESGIAALAIHGKSTRRDAILEDFESGKFQVLTAVNLLIEGVDIPSIQCIQWLRPTQSRAVYQQGNGRGFRPHESKSHLIILDHAGNFQRFGLPCDHIEWDLSDQKRSKKTVDEQTLSVQTCKECYMTFRTGVHECPHCGAEVEFKDRKLLIVEGELERIEKAATEAKDRRERKSEQGQARSLDELVSIGVRREMKNAAYWAARVYASRDNGRQHTKQEYLQARNIERQLRSVSA